MPITRRATLTAATLWSIALLTPLRPSAAQSSSNIPHLVGTVTGIVRQERTGRPLADATVFALNGSLNTHTDLTGRYTLDGVAASPDSDTVIIITARALGFYQESRGLIVRASGVDTLDFSMRLNGWYERFVIPDSGTSPRKQPPTPKAQPSDSAHASSMGTRRSRRPSGSV